MALICKFSHLTLLLKALQQLLITDKVKFRFLSCPHSVEYLVSTQDTLPFHPPTFPSAQACSELLAFRAVLSAYNIHLSLSLSEKRRGKKSTDLRGFGT